MVSRMLRRGVLSKRSDLRSTEPIQRCGHKQASDLPHIDFEKLGRIECPDRLVKGDRRDAVDGAG